MKNSGVTLRATTAILVLVMGFARVAAAQGPDAPPAEEKKGSGNGEKTAVAPPPEAGPPAARKIEATPAAAGSPALDGKGDTVVIAVRKIGDALAKAFDSEEGKGRYKTWAVVAFKENGKLTGEKQLGIVVASELENTLRRDHGYIMVERLRLAEVMKEIALGQAGVTEERDAAAIGHAAGADVLVVGQVSELGDKFRINARVITVDTAKVLAGASGDVEAAGLITLSSDAVVLRSKSGAVFRSVLIPGWGQFYNREEGKGVVIMSVIGVSLLGGIGFALAGANAEQTYKKINPNQNDPNFWLGPCEKAGDVQACIENQRLAGQQFYVVRNAMFVVTGLVWAYNIADAYIFGFEPVGPQKSLFTLAPLALPDGVGAFATIRF
jgi:TolB-like protein